MTAQALKAPPPPPPDYFESQIRKLARYLREEWEAEIDLDETAASLAIRLLKQYKKDKEG